jgi:hypothetical protein
LQAGANLKLPCANDEEFRTGRTPISGEVSDVKTRVKFFVLGIACGALASLPLGVNIGRDAPLMSNPFAERSLKVQVVERVKETIHDATKAR